MKLRNLLTIGLLSLAPSMLLAQSYPDPPEPATPSAPSAPRVVEAPRVPPIGLAVIAPVGEAPPAPSAPATTEELQQPPKPPKPARPPVAPAPVAAPAPAAAPAPPASPRQRGQMINVRIDVTLSDSKGSPKILTMTVADGENGMNRTTTEGQADYSFNADAQPSVVGDRIRLRLTADAAVPVEGEKRSDGSAPRLGLRQSQTVVLNDGESMEIARAADPTSDRAFTLTVKVKILR